MRNIVSSYVGKFKKEHRKRWRAAWVLLALALIVSAAVTWQLHSTGIAQTNVTYCGLEEHTHTEDCYEKVLVCGLEEESGGHTHVESCYDADGNLICGLEESEGHTHTDECYELQLVCGLEEHIHTVACLSDATADVETASDWEETLPELTEDAAENVVLVAESQIGYTESTANFTLADDGETRKGYTRYGAWYGEGFEYVDWDAMFAAFCLHYAGVSEEDFPVNSGAYAWMADLKTADLYADAADYTPKAGDLVFFDTDGDGKADTVGIVASAEGSESDEIATNGDATAITVSGDATEIAAAKIVSLSVIVGDYSEDSSVDAVCKLGYASDDESILGYGILPEDIEVILATENEDTEEQVLEDQTLSVIVEEYTVTLSGLLPSGASFAAELVDLELEDEEVQFALEITIYDADGNEFEPEDDAITVTVESDSITEDCAIYYVPEEGDLEEVGSEAEDGTVSFDAEHFSVYAGITSTAEGESAYDTYMATISEYEEEAYALADGDDEEAVALTSDLGDLLDAAYEDFEEGNLTEEEYAEIETAVNELWDWLEENFDLYGTSIASYYDENGELVTGDIHTNFSDNTSVTGNTWINLDEAGIEDPIVTTSGSLYNDKLDLKWDFSENDDNTPKCTGLLSISADENVVVAGCTDTRTGRVLLLDLNTFCNYDNEYTNGTVAALDNGLKVNYYYDESGNRIDNCGTITLEKVGNVLGQSVDVIITIESVTFSNSYASYLYEDDYNGNTGYWNIGNNKFANGVLLAKPQTKEKIIIGAWASGESEYSMQFCTTYDEYYDSNPYYSNSAYQRAFQFQFGYSYPCTQNVTASFKVVYSESGNVVDSQFLVVGSDIDVYRDGTDSHKRVFSEGFSTLAGFTGTFYKYTTNKNYIVGTGLGVMTARATVETSGGTSGVTSHTYAGVYAESKTGEWTCLYTDQQCGTYVEIYSPTYYDITIKKVSAADTAETLSGVQFKLYRLTDENEKEYYNSNNGGITSWGDSDSAKVITTNGTDGTAEIKNLEPGNYYLTEVVAANGYALLDHDIEITVSTFGVVSLEDTEDHASVDNSGGTVLLTIKNDKAYDVTLLKIDENGNAITDNPATFYLYKKIGDVEYYYKYDVSDYDHVTYVTTWVTDLNEATRIVTDTGTGQAALHDLTLGTTYYLRETDAPYGYSLLQEDASFTLESDESVTISPSSTGILSYSGCFADSDLVIKVKNEEADVYTIRIYKRDEVTNNVISEIKFSLYRLDEDGNKIYYYFLDSTVYWYADKKRIYSTSEYGSVNFTKLYPGTYYLQEESTVDGYFKLDENAVLGFTISEDGVVSLVDNADTDVIKLGKGDGDENNPASLTLCVYNTPYYELPSAGGSGTVPYTCVGVTLTAGAAGLLYRRRRKGKFA